MRDIWEVFLQTLTVSSVGIYLLVVKRIFRDKLSPLWQFSVWGIFLISLIIPAPYGGILSLIVETVKNITLNVYTVSAPIAFFPVISTFSIKTLPDILYLVYVSGVIVFSLKYLISYLTLRTVIKKCPSASNENLQIINEVCEKYKFKACKAVTLKGLSSPFVCGIINPVMVLPETTADEKIILHELLHLKNKDTVFGIITCIFRCIHWCNPFLHYCFNIINNDTEQLCDTRAIRLLDGEERREYGQILLSMANEKYSSFPGTSSAANGGKQIKSRIAAIARFKKYPVNNGFISVCITLILAFSLVSGASASIYPIYLNNTIFNSNIIMASVRSFYCSTPAGALDTYGKAVINNNAIYRAVCAPLNEHQSLADSIKISTQINESYTWDSGLDGYPANGNSFYIYNLLKNSDDSYNADIIIEMQHFSTEDTDEKKIASQKLHIFKENGRWVVSPISDYKYTVTYKMLGIWGCDDLDGTIYSANIGDFTVEYMHQTCSVFSDETKNTNLPCLSAQFIEAHINRCHKVIFNGSEEDLSNLHHIGLASQSHRQDLPYPVFRETLHGSFSSSTNQGTSLFSRELSDAEDRIFLLGGGGYTVEHKNIEENMPSCVAAGLYINNNLTHNLVLLRENDK